MQAPRLTRAFVDRMNDEVHPDLVFNLGDDIEDEDREADLLRYRECMSELSRCKPEVRHVAGNHDLINFTEDDLLAFWGQTGRVYYSFDRGGVHFVVLCTRETKTSACASTMSSSSGSRRSRSRGRSGHRSHAPHRVRARHRGKIAGFTGRLTSAKSWNAGDCGASSRRRKK